MEKGFVKIMFSKGEIIEFLNEIFGGSKVSGNNNNIYVKCPNCKNIDYSKRKLMIKIEFPFIYHCFKCGLSGRSIYFILRKYISLEKANQFKEKFVEKNQFLLKEDKENKIEDKELKIPDGFQLLAEKIDEKSDKEKIPFINYLEER